jgi:hypothetical protein
MKVAGSDFFLYFFICIYENAFNQSIFTVYRVVLERVIITSLNLVICLNFDTL